MKIQFIQGVRACRLLIITAFSEVCIMPAVLENVASQKTLMLHTAYIKVLVFTKKSRQCM
jgi:hypothetical protein